MGAAGLPLADVDARVRFEPSPLPGVVVVHDERHADDRGHFARSWDADAFAAEGLAADFVQANTAATHARGTLRGMHLQRAPHQEAKLFRCTRGEVFDVAVDLREGSPTRLQWFGVHLRAGDGRALHVAEGCAHGYLALTDDVEVSYLVTARYAPSAEAGVRWDDPAIGIDWPLQPSLVSSKDRAWPLLTERSPS